MEDTREVVDAASFDGDEEAILPDGWQDGDELFSEDVTEDPESLLADGPSDDELLAQLLAEDENPQASPTTGSPNGGKAAENAGAQNGEQTDGSAAPQNASRKLTLKVNHREQEVDVSSMSDDDLRALLQKGYAFDAMKDAEDRREFLRVYEEQIDSGMTETVARLVARDAVGRAYDVKDGKVVAPGEDISVQSSPTPQPKTPVNPRTTPPPGTQTRNLRAEVEQLRTLFPDVTEIPDPVAKAVAKGVNVTTAYLAYVNGQSQKTAANLRKENKTLRQNAVNAQRAPVRGVSGGATGNQKSDPFIEGFDSEKWD